MRGWEEPHPARVSWLLAALSPHQPVPMWGGGAHLGRVDLGLQRVSRLSPPPTRCRPRVGVGAGRAGCAHAQVM